ncbi:MAG: ComEC/Rec2 family competence protein [Candidatus Peribacteria bacterium]|jgi:competence protein ComEC|nr:ComEC/Rec2 family competence protein [Candidatus Peribacteria bacterium]
MQTYVEHIYGQNQYAGLLLGLLIGDKSLIPTEQYDTFVESGLVHIIAVSGGNIAMVVILLSFLLKWIPLYVRNGLIIVMIGGYAMICGGDSSVIRAALMGSLTLIALFWGREISIRRTMKYALGGILLFSPFSLVYDVGLLLSFSAIMGIVLVQKLSEQYALHLQPLATRSGNIQQGKKAGLLQSKFWKEYVVPTIGASLGTAPVLLFFMNGVNVVGIVLNIVIVPLIPVLTIYGFASLLLSALVQREGRIWGEVLMMKLVYGLSKFGKEYAIVVQAKNVVAKYVLMGLFIVGGIWGYRKVMQQQTPLK